MFRTSKDCAYQSLTLITEGISLRPSGNSSNSRTRCAKRIGSSSARNWDARNSVPEVGQREDLALGRCKRTDRGLLPKLDHLAQAHAGSGELGIVTDGIHQALRGFPRHDGRIFGVGGRGRGRRIPGIGRETKKPGCCAADGEGPKEMITRLWTHGLVIEDRIRP